jgi:uncharacterized protein
MGANINYPGVSIEELPSGQHAITGVATSITAFIGRTTRGPLNEPISIFNYGDYERLFEGLSVNYPLSYAVQDFFLNGGSQAVIVRLFEPQSPTDNGIATLILSDNSEAHETNAATDPLPALRFIASNPGSWGNRLSVSIDRNDITTQNTASYQQYGLQEEDLFNLTIRCEQPVTAVKIERFTNVTLKGGTDIPNRLDKVLSEQSQYLRLAPDFQAQTPDPSLMSIIETLGNDGLFLQADTLIGDADQKTGMSALLATDLFNLLCIPPDQRGSEHDTDPLVYQAASRLCLQRRAMLLVDPPADWVNLYQQGHIDQIDPASLGIADDAACNVSVYFPRIIKPDVLMNEQMETFPACGSIAGVIASTDTQRGVWKAPAGTSAGLNSISGLAVTLTDTENGVLNPLGINCLRAFPSLGSVVWGARTLRGNDRFADDYKYLPVRRLALFIEESLYRGIQWAVFEPNDEKLWAALRLNISTFLSNLSRQGAFFDFNVNCDATTTTQADINNGIVNILVQFAPLQPAEFISIKIQQVAGQNAA